MMVRMASEGTRETRAMAPIPIPSGTPGRPRVPDAWRTRLVIAGIVLAALNLRPAITSLGALLEEVRDGLGMSGTVAGLLTSVPPLCFAVFGVTAPRLARRFGSGAVVCAGMVVITLGLALRPFAGNTAVFLLTSACALMGIAVSNVLMPVIVKRWFPDRVGPMTGLYSMALALGTSVAAAAAVPLTGALGGSWRAGLGAWAVLGAVATLPWILLVRQSDAAVGGGSRAGRAEPRSSEGTGQESVGGDPGDAVRTSAPGDRLPEDADPEAAAAVGPGTASALPGRLRITRSPTAWALAVFFGLQASGAYITMGWMPQIFRDAGVSADTAGLLLAVIMVMGVPLAFVIPRVAVRLPRQGSVVVALGVCGLVGYAGLYLAPQSGALAWAVLLGISNCAFPLALTMVGMRAKTGAGVARALRFRAERRISDLHSRTAPGGHALSAQRWLGAADRPDGRADGAADPGRHPGRPRPHHRSRVHRPLGRHGTKERGLNRPDPPAVSRTRIAPAAFAGEAVIPTLPGGPLPGAALAVVRD